MSKLPEGWKISQRDNENHRLDKDNKNFKKMSPAETEKCKQEIIARHERLGLNKNLKKELYPEFF